MPFPRVSGTFERGVAVHPPSMTVISGTHDARGSDQARLRHTTTTAYRCFLPDLTGFTGRRCTGPDRQRHATHAATAMPDLGREFSPAGADCGYRAPLAPRLARHRRWYALGVFDSDAHVVVDDGNLAHVTDR